MPQSNQTSDVAICAHRKEQGCFDMGSPTSQNTNKTSLKPRTFINSKTLRLRGFNRIEIIEDHNLTATKF